MEKELKIRELKMLVQQSTQNIEQTIRNSITTNAELDKELKLYMSYKKELGRTVERVQMNQLELINQQRILCEKEEALKTAKENKVKILQYQENSNQEYKHTYSCLSKKIEAANQQMHQSGSNIKNRKEIMTNMNSEKMETERKFKVSQKQLIEVKEELCILHQDIQNNENETESIREEDQEIKSNFNEVLKQSKEKTKQLNEVKVEARQEERELVKLTTKQEEYQKEISVTENANIILQDNLTDTKEKGYLMGVENDNIAEHNKTQEVLDDKLTKMIDENTDQIEEFQMSNAKLMKKVAELEMQDFVCKFCQATIEE